MTLGLVAFTIGRNLSPQFFIGAQTGIMDAPTSSEFSSIEFHFNEEQPDIFYQVGVSNNSQYVETQIRGRTTTGFFLLFRKDGAEYDPTDLCVVTVDR